MVDAKKLGLMFHGDILGTKYYLSTYQQGSTMDSDSEGMMYAFRTHMNPVRWITFWYKFSMGFLRNSTYYDFSNNRFRN